MSSRSLLTDSANHPGAEEFLVICLCAEWCGVCRDYKTGFDSLTNQFSGTRFSWVDIEDRADALGELDVDSFPMIFIQRRQWILFYGAMPPHLGHLKQLINTFQRQSPDESLNYALSNPERRSWQESRELRRLGRIAEVGFSQ